jgi:nitrogen-specific signal transduction histidine kinase
MDADPPDLPDEQFYQMARLSIIGRLTASLLHDINNPLQAIRGSLSLALEDLADVVILQTYMELGIRESDRVIALIARVRRLYINDDRTNASVDMNILLQELIALTAKDLRTKQIKLELQLAERLPTIWAVFSDLSLALLCPLLTLSDLMAQDGGGKLVLRSREVSGMIEVSFITAVFPHQLPEIPLPVCRRVALDYGGHVNLSYQDGLNCLGIALPISNPKE